MPGARCTVPNHAFAGMTKLPLMLGHTWGHSRLQTSEIPQVVFFLRNRSHESLTTHTKARHGANADQPARTGFISTSRPGVPFLPRVGGRGRASRSSCHGWLPRRGPRPGRYAYAARHRRSRDFTAARPKLLLRAGPHLPLNLFRV
jgi:hypothetical protein